MIENVTVMRNILLMIVLTAASAVASGQDTLSLFRCHEMALMSNPVSGEKELLETSRELSLDKLTSNWYPALDLNGQFSWQSDVMDIGSVIQIPNIDIPSMPHDLYKLTLDIQQTLYDGGITRASKDLEISKHEASRQQVEVELNKLKYRVNQLYFMILLLQQQEQLLTIKSEELEEKREIVASGVRNGVLMASNLDVMDAEMLKLGQQIRETGISLHTGKNILARLTGADIKDNTILAPPDIHFENDQQESKRPEYQMFDLQISCLDASKKLSSSARRPKVYAFGQLGYGKPPGASYFSDEFGSFYMVGAGLKWRIWDWNRSSKEQQLLSVQQEVITTKKQAFSLNLMMSMEEDMGQVVKFREMVGMDRQIVDLRRKVRETAASQLENGVITSNDYLVELNAEIEARITLAMHKLQLIQSQIDYLTTRGDL